MLNKEEILKMAISEIPVVAGNLTMKGTEYTTDLRANFIKGYTHCQQIELPEVAIGFAEFAGEEHRYIGNGKWGQNTGYVTTTTELFKQYCQWLEKQKEGV